MANKTATVHDFSFGQFQRTHARHATHAETQTATSVFSDMADGILVLDFALTFAGFGHQARQFVLSIVGLIGDGQTAYVAFDKDLAKHLNCNERTVRRWRKAYIEESEAKNFGFLHIIEGEYRKGEERYEATEYGLNEEVKDFVNNTISEARESPRYAEDRRACLERIAKENYGLIPNAPPLKRRSNRGTLPERDMDRALARAQKNVEQWRVAVRDLPKPQRAALLASEEGARQHEILLQIQQDIADSLALFPANVDTEEVKYVPDKMSGTPPDLSGMAEEADGDGVDVRVKEEYTRTPEEAAAAEAAWNKTFAGFNTSPVRAVEVPIFDDPPDEPTIEPPELVYDPDADELAARGAVEAEALNDPLKSRFEVGALVFPVNADGEPLHDEPSPIAEARYTGGGAT